MDIAKHLTSNLVLITGHYGCGKTNLSINMALDLARREGGLPVKVVDLDIVNPYFRVSDSTRLLEEAGIDVVAPNFAGTTLDTPSLPPAVLGAIDAAATGDAITLIDVGGDPEGAMAIARFTRAIAATDYQLVYIVNQKRLQTTHAQEAAELLVEIEQTSGLRATHIVGNTHLKGETTAHHVVDAIPFTLGVCELTELPLAFVTSPAAVYDEVLHQLEGASPTAPDVYRVDVYVKTPWD